MRAATVVAWSRLRRAPPARHTAPRHPTRRRTQPIQLLRWRMEHTTHDDTPPGLRAAQVQTARAAQVQTARAAQVQTALTLPCNPEVELTLMMHRSCADPASCRPRPTPPCCGSHWPTRRAGTPMGLASPAAPHIRFHPMRSPPPHAVRVPCCESDARRQSRACRPISEPPLQDPSRASPHARQGELVPALADAVARLSTSPYRAWA